MGKKKECRQKNPDKLENVGTQERCKKTTKISNSENLNSC